MIYQECQPPAHFSPFVECYWSMKLGHGTFLETRPEMMLPNCTLNILFVNQPFRIKNTHHAQWESKPAGNYLLGQRSQCLSFMTDRAAYITGIRLKPFALSGRLPSPAHLFTDQLVPLTDVFGDVGCEIHDFPEKSDPLDRFLNNLFCQPEPVDHALRAQINYILERKGLIRVNDMLSEFGLSKVTIRNHFINKVGLPPKKISRIWRMNYFFLLQSLSPHENLTSLSLQADYYDQAHFNREFKSLMGQSPRAFFQQHPAHLKVTAAGIAQRFSNQYDPR
ncbi:MAG: AraC family transcriptional regulator [Bacteroidota bacterium]